MDFRNQYEGLLFRAAKLLQYPLKLHFGHEPSGPRPNLTPARIWTVQSANFYRISNVYYDEACAEFHPLYILMWVYSNVRQCQQFVNQQKQSSLLKIQGFCVKTHDKILAMLWSIHCQEHIFTSSVWEWPANRRLQRIFLPIHVAGVLRLSTRLIEKRPSRFHFFELDCGWMPFYNSWYMRLLSQFVFLVNSSLSHCYFFVAVINENLQPLRPHLSKDPEIVSSHSTDPRAAGPAI